MKIVHIKATKNLSYLYFQSVNKLVKHNKALQDVLNPNMTLFCGKTPMSYMF